MKRNVISVFCVVCAVATTSAQTKSGGISQEMLKDIQKEVVAEPVNKALVNAVAANSIDALAKNHQNAGALDTYFNVETKKQSITDSGRRAVVGCSAVSMCSVVISPRSTTP